MPQLQITPRGFIAGVVDRLARAASTAVASGRLPVTGVGSDTQKSTAPFFALDYVSGSPWAPRDYAAFAREGFMQNPIVYRSVRMIAEAAASVPIMLYDGPHEIEEHPLLRLIDRPTPTTTRAEFFETLIGFLLVSGNAYVEASALNGELRELHILRPDRIQIVPGEDGWPEAYDYAVDGASPIRLDGEAVPGVRRVLHQKLFHPLNDHYGLSPIEAAASAIDIHNAASRWNKALLDNSARPSGALVYTSRDGNLTTEQYDRLKSELETGFQGAGNAGRPLLLEGGLDWKSMSMSPKDLDFMEAKHGAAREIALALGVPPMLLGIPGDNTFSNYQEANRTFWRQTVLPLVQRTTDAFSEWLAPSGSGTLRFAADLDDIAALNDERDALWTRLEKTSFLSNDEKRAAVGYGPQTVLDAAKPDASKRSETLLDQKYPGQPRTTQGRFDFGQQDGDVVPVAKLPPKAPPPPPAKPATPPPKPIDPPSKNPGAYGKTPKGREFAEHGQDQANLREFTGDRIDAIVDNNAAGRVSKIDAAGRKTWEYSDNRGNTIVTNERGGIVTVFSPVPGGKYIPKP
jgi:HK97 family phage portal protein